MFVLVSLAAVSEIQIPVWVVVPLAGVVVAILFVALKKGGG